MLETPAFPNLYRPTKSTSAGGGTQDGGGIFKNFFLKQSLLSASSTTEPHPQAGTIGVSEVCSFENSSVY